MFRITKFNNMSVTEIQFQFSGPVSTQNTLDSLVIRSSINFEPLAIKSIEVDEDVLTVTTAAQRPLINYTVSFGSSGESIFMSAEGERLQNPTFFFLGQEAPNDIRVNMLDLPSVYDGESDNFLRKTISALADELLDQRTGIRSAGNANYISVDVSSEQSTRGDLPEEIITRGFGSSDRLLNESAYFIERVSRSPSGSTSTATFNMSLSRADALSDDPDSVNPAILSFPYFPISLRFVDVVDEIVSNEEVLLNKFSGLVLTLSRSNVAVIHSVTLNGTTHYNLAQYGYLMLDNRYDPQSARSYTRLESNQIQLSDSAVLNGDFAIPESGDEIIVSYSYVDPGLNVDSTTVEISRLVSITREVCPPLASVFNLTGNPVVTPLDTIPSIGYVSFLDPNPASAAPFSLSHPAFRNQIIYSTARLPRGPGEYAIDYATGRVFAWGAVTNDGTGSIPPVATYTYRRTFSQGIDYNISSDDDLVGVPGRDLIGGETKIKFDFERNFVPFVDFIPEVHSESLDEYVGSKHNIQRGSVISDHFPITNVFEVFNETTGEAYVVTRFDKNQIFYSGRELPQVLTQPDDQTPRELQAGELITLTEEISNNGTLKLVKLQLLKLNVLSQNLQSLACNTNTSLDLSQGDVFVSEFFFDDALQTLSENLSKITVAGDYTIDYKLGRIYLVTSVDTISFGQASYYHGTLLPINSQILGVNDISYKVRAGGNSISKLQYASFDETSVTLGEIPSSIERFYQSDFDRPILLGTKQFGAGGQTVPSSYEFVAVDGLFEAGMADGYHILRIPGDPDRSIVTVSSETSLIVDIPFSDLDRAVPWYIVDFNLADGYSVVTNFDPLYVNGIYTVTDLQTNPRGALTNLFDPTQDIISGDSITFNNSVAKLVPPGTALAIDYVYGFIHMSHNYVRDVVRISYEWGDNQINWSVSDELSPGDTYYVSYKYGALREKLLANFGSLTQVPELTNFPLTFDRELYRKFVGGALSSFVAGPTTASVKSLVRSVTEIDPEVVELSFDEWTVGRDSLYRQKAETTGTIEFETGRYGYGLHVGSDTVVRFPSESYVSYREGTFEVDVHPDWAGLDNTADLIVEFSGTEGNIFIGETAFNPDSTTFTLERDNEFPLSPIGRPNNWRSVPGHFVWFDPDELRWHVDSATDGYGSIETDGGFYDIVDGYALRSTIDTIQFDGYGDMADGSFGMDGYELRNSFTFTSNRVRTLFDMEPGDEGERMSLFVDTSGYLVFSAISTAGKGRTRLHQISYNVQGWSSGERHHVACSWRFNTSDSTDQMHLFVDGQEVSNNFKFGGKPATTTSDIFRTVASEAVVVGASVATVSGRDGRSTSGSPSFLSLGSTFVDSGIQVGDLLYILDATADGAGSPYSINGVSQDTLTLASNLTLSVQNVSFSVNQVSVTCETNVDFEKIAVYTYDGYTETELSGVNSLYPDYSTSRAPGVNTLVINNGIDIGDNVYIRTLGLTAGRCSEITYCYSDGYYTNTLETRGVGPVDMDYLDVWKVPVPRIGLQDGYEYLGDGYQQAEISMVLTASQLDGYMTNLCQPSNIITGKAFAATLTGSGNVDFGGTNTVTIWGTTFGGPTSEVLSFSNYGTETTAGFFLSVDFIEFALTAVDPLLPLGALEISEALPLTYQENNGDYAQLAGFENGIITLVVYGSGGDPYIVEPCFYRVDYLSPLYIRLKTKGKLTIGCSANGDDQFRGTIDQVIFLNEMLSDVRTGEENTLTRSITQDYNNPLPAVPTTQTMMLLSFNDKAIENIEENFRVFSGNHVLSSNSVNAEFGNCMVVDGNDPYIEDNGRGVLANNEGSVEFWLSPMLDTWWDRSAPRYYVDASSIQSTQILSSSRKTIILPTAVSRIVKITTLANLEVDLFKGGKLGVDGKTVFLSSPLPAAQMYVTVHYVSVDFSGDRFSIFKSGSSINFSIVAKDQEYVISYPIRWARGSWHRILATWKTNTIDGDDSMRLFVDGLEAGTVLWGAPGLTWGGGSVWGSAAVGTVGSKALTGNIDFEDTISRIFMGSGFDGSGVAHARFDNVRFSNIVREPVLLGGIAYDLNYTSSLDTALPVVTDNHTMLLLNFEQELVEQSFMANLYSESTPATTMMVKVDDSFGRLTTTAARELIIKLIDRMKPSHVRLLTEFASDRPEQG